MIDRAEAEVQARDLLARLGLTTEVITAYTPDDLDELISLCVTRSQWDESDRNRFARHAMLPAYYLVLNAGTGVPVVGPVDIARKAYQLADAMLDARDE